MTNSTVNKKQTIEVEVKKFSKVEMEDLDDKISKAKFLMLLKYPFYAIISVKMDIIWDEKIRTAATDGYSLIFSPSFVDKLTVKQLVFVISHEILHMAFMHFLRRGNRQPLIWNWACDFAINQILLNEEMIDVEFLKGYCYDPKYNGMGAEEIYKLLMNEFSNQLEKILQDIKDGKYAPGDAVKCPNGNGITVDVHCDWGSSDNKDNPELNGSELGDKLDEMSKEESEKRDNNIRNNVIQASKSAEMKKAGTTPADILRLVEEWTSARINWKQMIHVAAQSMVKDNSSFMRVGRRTWSQNDFIFPGKTTNPTYNIAIAIDLSGSISDEDKMTFLSEIQAITNYFPRYQIIIWSFDHKCYPWSVFSDENPEELLTYATTKMKGGGGTDIGMNWKYLEDNMEEMTRNIGENPGIFICFTDGYGPLPDKKYADLVEEQLWVIKDGDKNQKKNYPFGTVAFYEDA